LSSIQSLPEPISEPPKSERRTSLAVITEWLLRFGSWRRNRKFDGSALFANADPPVLLSQDIIKDAVPDSIPESIEVEAYLNRVKDQIDLPPLLQRTWLWTIALHRQVAETRLNRRIRGIREMSYGFVGSGKKVSLAVIFYVRRAALIQAPPLWLEVGSHKFPIVLRPPYEDSPTSKPLSFPQGLATARARLGKKLGTLTAAHVVSPDGNRTSVAKGQSVKCFQVDTGECQRPIISADPVMDAALIEDGTASGNEPTIRANPFPGCLPVEMYSPDGQLVTGWVTEVPIPEGVVPGQYGKTPTSPAMLPLTFNGENGWSGGMVWETTAREFYGQGGMPRPYGMFVGVRKLRTRNIGRMNMLHQLELVWRLELLDE